MMIQRKNNNYYYYLSDVPELDDICTTGSTQLTVRMVRLVIFQALKFDTF